MASLDSSRDGKFPIPGFSGYFVDRYGNVFSKKSGDIKQLKGEPRKEDGRLRYSLKSDYGKLVRRYGSYFVLLSFVGPPPDGHECCHKNGNCLDDSVENLRWGTPYSNKEDMLRHGTRLRGESHPRSKVSDSEAEDIEFRRLCGEELSVLAKEYGITESAVCFISKGRGNQCLRRKD